MTRDECVNIIRTISTFYDNFKVSSEKVNAWFAILGKYDYNEIGLALTEYVEHDTSGFAPSIGQLVSLRSENQKSVFWSNTEKMLLGANYDKAILTNGQRYLIDERTK